MNLGLSSKADWIRRVSLTLGTEALCDGDWRFVAASGPMLESLRVREEAIVGRRAADMPQFQAYATALKAIPFFDGSLRGVQFRSEFWVEGKLTAKDMDLWAICTDTSEMLVHMVSTKTTVPKPAERFAGYRISDFRAIMLNGRVFTTEAVAAFLS